MSDDNYRYSDEEEYEYSDEECDYTSSNTPGTGSSSSTFNGANKSGKGSDYRIVNAEELKKEKDALIQDIASVLELESSPSEILLRHFSWNKEKLLEQYCTDTEAARRKAGIQYLGKLDKEKSATDVVRFFFRSFNLSAVDGVPDMLRCR